jgi:hypothetical protein
MRVFGSVLVILILVGVDAKKKPAAKNGYQVDNTAYEKYRYPRNAIQAIAQRKPTFAAPQKVPQSQPPVQVTAPVQENQASEVVLEELVVVEEVPPVVMSIMTIDPTPTTRYVATVYETVTEFDTASVITVRETVTASYDRWE